MKNETVAYLTGADKAIFQARAILEINFPEQAARLAYYAEFYAAQALIFERTERVAKTHKGVRRLFHQLAAAETGMDPRLAGDLTHGYQFKQLADYEAGTDASVSLEDAADAIEVAVHFVASVRQSLTA